MPPLTLLIKTFGIGVALLLFAYAAAIAYTEHYRTVDNRYASAMSTFALVVLFVALGGFLAGSFDELIELLGYLVAAIGGTWGLLRIEKHPTRFENA